MPSLDQKILQLYPGAPQKQQLKGLYLSETLHRCLDKSMQVCIYTNYIVSLDGRIALAEHAGADTKVPQALANPADWRLYQELAAQADLLLTSGRYLRELEQGHAQDSLPLSRSDEFSDLHAWRIQQGLTSQPAVGIITASLDLPYDFMKRTLMRDVTIYCGDAPPTDKLTEARGHGFQVVECGNGGNQVEGKALHHHILAQGYKNVYAIAGPGILETLLRANVLDRLYLTQVHRLLGGTEFDTLLEAASLKPPADFSLKAMYLYTEESAALEQTFYVYESNRTG